VGEAMRYAALSPGKLIRPALLIAVGDLYATPRPRALAAGCAVEMAHACSLILDDLPSMDDAGTRRGRPATHRAFGEATAILAAFGLLNRAFEILASEASIPEKARPELARRLAAALGTDGLIAGQALDLALAPSRCSLDELERIHSRKTGSLFIACVEIGSLLGRAPAAEAEALRGFAKNLGLAYQIVDDLLDASGDSARAGKTLNADRRGNFVTLSGIEGARRLSEELFDCAVDHLSRLGRRGALLRGLARILIQRDR
jgi:farnesyl diphosphate synthase